MIVICEECCKVIGYKEGEGLSHGRCDECLVIRRAEVAALNAVADAMGKERRA